MKEKGKISYPFLGVRYVLIDEDFQKENNLPVDYGALVVRGENQGEVPIISGSAADKAGVEENDIILEINGEKITADNPLAYLVAKYEAGEIITLKLLHKGQERTAQATLGERQ